MDGRTVYSRILKMLANKKVGKIYHMQEIRQWITISLGSNERTIVGCLRTMGDMGFLKDLGDYKFKLLKNE